MRTIARDIVAFSISAVLTVAPAWAQGEEVARFVPDSTFLEPSTGFVFVKLPGGLDVLRQGRRRGGGTAAGQCDDCNARRRRQAREVEPNGFDGDPLSPAVPRRGSRKMVAPHLWPVLALAVSAAGAMAAPDEITPDPQSELARGQSALRAMDCARCHGRDYRGWSGPSLVAAARDGSLERFRYFVLEGDPVRGMPGYRSQPLVIADIDAMYAYLRARSHGAPRPSGPASLVPPLEGVHPQTCSVTHRS